MARFKYLGENRSLGAGNSFGPTVLIRMRGCDGTCHELAPVPPATYFAVGEDIGYDITEERCLRHMRADTLRFEEIL